MKWPQNKQFALTIFDDTDNARLEDVYIVYNFLRRLGFRTTKSVWIFNSLEGALHAGVTCEDVNYLSFVKELKESGF